MRPLNIVFATALTLAAAQSHAAVLIHDYQLNDATDTLGGPSLTANGGTFAAGVYTFETGQGLSLSNGLAPTDIGNYSIYLRASWDDIVGFKRYIDFKDYTSDTGFYNLNGALNFYNEVTGPTAPIQPLTLHDIVITRDGTTDDVVGYVDGVQQWTFNDDADLAVFDKTEAIMHFFQDDTQVPGEHGPGVADRIQIYSGVLTPAEVAAIPEPTALAPLLIAATTLTRRRR